MAQPLNTDPVDILLGDDNDLVVTDDLQFALGLEGITQMCRIAVQMFAGEWFLDLDVGVPYWDNILGQNPEVAKFAALTGFRDELLAVDGVLEIISLEVTFTDAATRTLNVTWQVRTAAGNTPVDTIAAGVI